MTYSHPSIIGPSIRGERERSPVIGVMHNALCQGDQSLGVSSHPVMVVIKNSSGITGSPSPTGNIHCPIHPSIPLALTS